MNIMYMIFHPNLSNSRVGAQWAEQVRARGKATMVRDLYKEYPDFQIDIEREEKLLLEHDRIVVQFPFYWYSSPALFKQWQDDVLSYGFAYGSNGNSLAGKEIQLVVSVGGAEETYKPGNYNNYSVSEFLRPFQQMANLTQMTYLPPLWMHRAVVASDKEIVDFGDYIIEALDEEDRGDPRKILRKAIAEVEGAA